MSIVTSIDLLKQRRTKIVATVGPASSAPETLRALIEAGVNVFRVNMSHGTQAEHAAAIAAIREQASALGTHIGILADLCGPKIRTGRFEQNPVRLEEGAEVTVTTREVIGNARLVPSQYAGLADDVKPGDRILINDGAAELEVLAKDGTEVRCRVRHGGVVGDKKGINLPGVEVSAPSLTPKDIADAEFALAQQVDFIALSFVRTRADVVSLLRIVDAAEWRPAVIAKMEKPEALENVLEILQVADGIMVARGDLGVELPPEQVPLAQSQLVTTARLYDKPVIVATQMLESMISAARPTRAEVTDVSQAVASGADAIMLSGETATGEFPVEAVQTMDRIARQTESYQFHTRPVRHGVHTDGLHGHLSAGDAVASAAAHLVTDTQARAVVVISMNGITAMTIAAARPDAPMLVVCKEAAVCRRVALLWGVVPVLDQSVGVENPNFVARRVAREAGLAAMGHHVVLVRGFHSESVLNTPSITLLTV